MSERRPLWEMFMKPVFASFVLLAVAFGAALAKPENLKPLKTWKGSVADEALEKTAPTVIVSQKTLDAVWEQWKQPGKAPTVDFDKELIAVTNTRGGISKASMIHNNATPKIEVDPENYLVKADGELLMCEPAEVLPMAQRYFLF